MSFVNTAQADDASAQGETPIPAEILAAIAVAAAVFAGTRLRIRAIEQLRSSKRSESKWLRQGRVLVQASHNLPVRH
jgi:hypothetical protein